VTPELLTDITIFVLAILVGFEVISKVPATLHTPLMSAANSIHGIVLAGAMLIAVTAHDALGYILAFIACAFAAMNVVGGYVVTGRMLKMFKRARTPVQAADGASPVSTGPVSTGAVSAGAVSGNGQTPVSTQPGGRS
jgi:proton-translocating NAD(P)+ transhydrogenase subunit alpha